MSKPELQNINYYLKCEQCNHYNLLNTKYLVFCGKCNQKIKNNYPEWQKNNPEKNYTIFKKEIAVNSLTLDDLKFKKSQSEKYLQGRKKLFWIIIILLFIIFLVIIYFVKTYL